MKLLSHLQSNSLLSRCQFGFRPFSSTQEAIISATTDWHKILDMKANNVAAVFFDLLKAFDTIPHSGILNALSNVGVSGPLYKCFSSYLSNRQQCVVLEGHSSSPANISSGVPQVSLEFHRAPSWAPCFLSCIWTPSTMFHSLKTLNFFMPMTFCYTLQLGTLLISPPFNLMWTQFLSGISSQMLKIAAGTITPQLSAF